MVQRQGKQTGNAQDGAFNADCASWNLPLGGPVCTVGVGDLMGQS